jgi:hypothetical protein
MPDEQDLAEALDGDKLGGEYPPERPLGAHRRQDDAIPESFAGRDARTQPEVDEADRRVSAPVHAGEDEPMDGDVAITTDDEVAETPEAAEEAALHVRELPD